MKYTLRQLNYFVSAADHGSISDAARSLNVSQPSVSNAIIQLEKQYGVSLFLRNNSYGVRPTPSGEILLREARVMMDHAADFDAIATSVRNEVSGEIRIASFVNVAPVYMAALTRSFNEKYPNSTVNMMIGNQQEVLDAIAEGRYEIGLTFDLGLTNEFRVDFVKAFPPQLVVSNDHPIAKQEQADLSDVISEPFIYLDLPHSKSYFFSLFENQNLRPEQVISVGSFETIRTFIGNGLGYSVLNLKPKNLRTYDGTRVKYIPLKGAHRPLKLCCVSLRRSVYRRSTLAFISHVKEYFS